MILSVLSLTAKNQAYEQTVSILPSSGFSRSFPTITSETNITAIEKITPKIFNRFNKKFHNVTNVKWDQLGDKFLATFSVNETTTRSLFSRKGKIIYTINYSSEKNLPDDVRSLVNERYTDYTITSVAQVLEKKRKIWVVKLKNNFDYRAARVEKGELEEVENFKIAN